MLEFYDLILIEFHKFTCRYKPRRTCMYMVTFLSKFYGKTRLHISYVSFIYKFGGETSIHDKLTFLDDQLRDELTLGSLQVNHTNVWM